MFANFCLTPIVGVVFRRSPSFAFLRTPPRHAGVLWRREPKNPGGRPSKNREHRVPSFETLADHRDHRDPGVKTLKDYGVARENHAHGVRGLKTHLPIIMSKS
jgi:hypothetical protein